MPHVDLPEGLPGIIGPLVLRPETGKPLTALADALLRGPSPLSRGERELIAAYVSARNDCGFCAGYHGAMAACQIDGGRPLTDAVLRDDPPEDLAPKLRALLRLADQVREAGLAVTSEAMDAAREHGATDVELHDTVLIAAAFAMFNRYVDGLATVDVPNVEAHDAFASQVSEVGYAAMVAGIPAPRRP